MSSGEQLRVGIIMGSDSDLPTMKHAVRALEEVGLEELKDFEMDVRSVHRTPDRAIEYAKTAEDRGLQVIIAGAGGSAHLPGIVASETILPVLGVAVTKNPDVMNRALGSMIGMPEGVPLATFQTEAGAFDAGLLAARILALHDPELRQAYHEYEQRIKSEVVQKSTKLSTQGSEVFLRDRRMAEELRQNG